MNAELKSVYSPDVDLDTWLPDDPTNFGIQVTLLAGPAGSGGEESFEFTVCSADWFKTHHGSEMRLGRHFLFMPRFNRAELISFVESFCRACSGESWAEVAARLGRLGHWEFEDYQP